MTDTLIARDGAHIYITCDIDNDMLAEFAVALREARSAAVTLSSTPEVVVSVNSDGGNPFVGFAIADMIRADRNVTTIVEGLAASAASLIALAGKRRLMRPHAWVLIHGITTRMWGKQDEITDHRKQLERHSAQIVDYLVSVSACNRKDVLAMLRRETWLSADDCLRLGLIDEVLK